MSRIGAQKFERSLSEKVEDPLPMNQVLKSVIQDDKEVVESP
jgi:hypothetical protein